MPEIVPVIAETFIRAESDLYMSIIALTEDGFGQFEHHRQLSPIENQTVVRMNRDTLYSAAVFDLDAGPVTITLPDAGARFMSLQIIDEDQYSPPAIYRPGLHTFTKAEIGTRYMLVGIRTFVDPSDPADMAKAHALQDALKVEQDRRGAFEVPSWDPASQKVVRDALKVLAATVPDTSGAFGVRGQVDPVRRLIGAAATWGGNPLKDAMYVNVTPPKNDGKTAYRLNVRDVPVDGFWSVIVYNAEGYIPANDLGVYSFNGITAKPDADGSVTIQFGACDGQRSANCLPIVPGWSYTVRLYRRRPEILSGRWAFPEASEVG
jgi:hypothetical protein